MTPEKRANQLLEIVERINGHFSLRVRGEPNSTLWTTGDRALIEERARAWTKAVAAAIRAAVAEEREAILGHMGLPEYCSCDPAEKWTCTTCDLIVAIRARAAEGS